VAQRSHPASTLPWGVRALLGYDKHLCAATLAAFVKERFRSLKHSNGAPKGSSDSRACAWRSPGPSRPFNAPTACNTADDGSCDDGGKDTTDSRCAYGNDCSDCGALTEPLDPTCNNTCVPVFSNGVCDDGGPGAETEKCDLGIDCVDCGLR
jgi:hypothetical protein